ncbi:MAG: nickel pincer cofactor biosynthesis protein LarC [Lentisphaerae bacterium]|nr:nickel pincer cofactor biosynthesis protein LarC [Lentisphaerota bacterium]
MNLLRFDSVGGASGDMILATLIDAGVKVADLRRPLATLPIGDFALRSRRVTRDGLSGTHVSVAIPHDHHHDDHDHGHGHDRHHHHEHRTMRTIRGIIRKSRLPAAVKETSVAVFQALAESEGRIHRMPPDDVHFHEVGAVDSIVDIVGACIALDLLGVQAVSCGPLPCGVGTIQCAHGVMPNPAPATLDLLKGFPVEQTDEPFELVTPTGAALLTAWQQRFPAGSSPVGVIRASGTGFGTRTLHHRPNLLRVTLLESASHAADSTHDDCLVLECNLDDMNPEWIGTLTQRLLAAGALDAFTAAVHMKKQRPGTLLTVLCRPADREAMLDLLFRESTTFGVREHLTRRTMLERRFVDAKTPYGKVRVKEGLWKGRVVTRAPEHDDCARAAERHGIAVRVVYQAALRP